MTQFEFLMGAINALREMEQNGTPAEVVANFDRFVREEIFGSHKIELTFDELVELQDYYIATL